MFHSRVKKTASLIESAVAGTKKKIRKYRIKQLSSWSRCHLSSQSLTDGDGYLRHCASAARAPPALNQKSPVNIHDSASKHGVLISAT